MDSLNRSKRWQFVVFPLVGFVAGYLSCPVLFVVGRLILPEFSYDPSNPGPGFPGWTPPETPLQTAFMIGIWVIPPLLSAALFLAGYWLARRLNRPAGRLMSDEEMLARIREMADTPGDE
jgi:hypothetical protein